MNDQRLYDVEVAVVRDLGEAKANVNQFFVSEIERKTRSN